MKKVMKKIMKKATRLKYYKLLTNEREKVVQELMAFKPVDDHREIIEEMEAANIGVLNNIALRLNSRKYHYLKKVEQSLVWLSEGTYGECQDCGCEISMRRLMARPTAELCTECKSERESVETNQAVLRGPFLLGNEEDNYE